MRMSAHRLGCCLLTRSEPTLSTASQQVFLCMRTLCQGMNLPSTSQATFPNSANCNLSNKSGLRERTRPAFILVIGDCSSPAESLAAPTHSTCHMLIFLSVQQGSGRRTDHRGYRPPTRRKLMVTLREPELKILSVFNGFPNGKKKKCRMKSIWVLKKSEVRLFTPNYWWINMSRNEFVYCSFVLLCSV